TSKKDQRQYWYRTDIPYSYVSVDDFSEIFKTSYWGRMLDDELSKPYDKSQSHKTYNHCNHNNDGFLAHTARCGLVRIKLFIRFLRQFLLLIFLHMSSTSMCRSLAAVFKTDVAATTVGSLVLVLMFLFGGFILPRPSLPKWLRWGFWLSPMSYGEIGITLNEFLAPRWQKIQDGNITVGREILKSRGLDFDSNFFWISIGALLGFTVVFDILFVVALTYLKGESYPS
ncbi:pleiotropic drug resistance protein 3-like, partial [Trifolium medium]|nr:pleiotropic drug resistance protein 3-like [Trifolium medium]